MKTTKQNKQGSSKLAFVLPSLAHGGAQKVFLEIAGYLALNDTDVTLISLDRDGELLSQLDQAKFKVHFLDDGLAAKGIFKRVRQLARLHALVRKLGIKKVYSTITGMNIFTLFCFLLARDVHLTIREATTFQNNASRLLKLMIWALYRRADRVICTSSFIRSELIDWANLEEQKVVFYPNPVDIDRIRKLALEKYEQYPVYTEDKYNIVAVGRLIEAKGFDVLIEAIEKVKTDRKVSLTIVGDGPERDRLASLVDKLDLKRDVFLIGYQSNPYPYMYGADLFVLSSRWEGYVNTVIEAMALEVDVILTDCNSGPGELIRTELGDTLVTVGSSDELANAIVNRIDHPKDPERFKPLVNLHSMPIAIQGYTEEKCEFKANN